MNKKGLSTIVETLLIILLTLVAIGIIWIVVRNVVLGEMPQYKITKEVCHEEQEPIGTYYLNDLNETDCPKNITLSGKCYLTNDKQFMVNVEVDENLFYPGGTLNYTWYSLNYLYNVSKIKEVCETQEVENIFGIELITDKWFYPNRDGIDWLKENCECIDKPYGTSVCKWNVPDDCIIDRSITGLYTVNSSRPECLNCGQEYVFPEDCTQFKCGDYQVEVLR